MYGCVSGRQLPISFFPPTARNSVNFPILYTCGTEHYVCQRVSITMHIFVSVDYGGLGAAL